MWVPGFFLQVEVWSQALLTMFSLHEVQNASSLKKAVKITKATCIASFILLEAVWAERTVGEQMLARFSSFLHLSKEGSGSSLLEGIKRASQEWAQCGVIILEVQVVKMMALSLSCVVMHAFTYVSLVKADVSISCTPLLYWHAHSFSMAASVFPVPRPHVAFVHYIYLATFALLSQPPKISLTSGCQNTPCYNSRCIPVRRIKELVCFKCEVLLYKLLDTGGAVSSSCPSCAREKRDEGSD